MTKQLAKWGGLNFHPYTGQGVGSAKNSLDHFRGKHSDGQTRVASTTSRPMPQVTLHTFHFPLRHLRGIITKHLHPHSPAGRLDTLDAHAHKPRGREMVLREVYCIFAVLLDRPGVTHSRQTRSVVIEDRCAGRTLH